MKVALVHDQLAEFGGAERVLISLKKIYPEADVYVSFVDRNKLGMHWAKFENWKIIQSRARFIPFFSKLYSPLRFLLPWIWRSFDLSKYDLVICSSSWGMCKGVSLQKLNRASYKLQATSKEELGARSSELKPRYVCYLHTPPRYLYGYDESALKKYLLVRIYARIVNHFLRIYDYESSQTVDNFIFNSEEIRQRSLKFYRRDGIVIHPPIYQTANAQMHPARSSTPEAGTAQHAASYFLTVSRLAPTKHIDIIIKACNELRRKLIVVGVGNQKSYLRSIAGPTISFKGHVPDDEFERLYEGASAFLYASVDEDFGMVPVEAMAHGVPVIAHASGGVKETVTHLERGIQYTELTPDALSRAIRLYEDLSADDKSKMISNGYAFAQMCDEKTFMTKTTSYIGSILNKITH